MLPPFIVPKAAEKIAYQGRRHLFSFFPILLITLFCGSLPLIFIFLSQLLFPNFALQTTGYSITVLGISLYYLALCVFFYSSFIDYYLDTLIITNDRLVHIEQKSLFSRSISEMDLTKLQDVTSEVSGFFPSLFNYGTIRIQSAGAVEEFVLKNVPHPNTVRGIIIDMSNEDQRPKK